MRSPPNNTSRFAFWLLVIFFIITTLLIGFVTDERTRSLLKNTLMLSTGTTLIALPLGTLLAACITRTTIPGRRILGFLLAVLLFTPLYLQTAGWNAGFGQQGWWQVDQLQTTPPLSGWRGAIWVHAMAATPWVALIMAAALTTVNRQWEELALLDANPGQVFLRVTLPQCGAAAMVAAIFILITTAGEISVTDVYQIRTYAEELYIGFARDLPPAEGGIGELETTVFSATLIVAWLTLGALVLWNWMWSGRQVFNARALTPFRLGKLRWSLGLTVAAIILFMVGVPLGNLIWKLGIEVQQIGADRVRTWSLAKSLELMSNAPSLFDRELGWTLAMSQVSALASLAIALPLAWMAYHSRIAAGALALLVTLSVAIPGPALAIVLIRFFSQPDSEWLAFLYDRTIAAPCLSMTIRAFPWVALILWAAFRSVPTIWIDNARLENIGIWRQLVRIVLPNRWAAVGCAWFVAVALTAGELTTSILLVPPGVNTLAIRIFGLVHYGVEDRLAALCLWSTVLFTGLSLAIVWMAGAWRRGR